MMMHLLLMLLSSPNFRSIDSLPTIPPPPPPPPLLPNQRFLVIESLKSPSGLTFFSFAGPIIRFLHITGPRKQLEGCRLEKVGSFPTGHTGRSTERVNNITHPFKHTVVHLQEWLLLPYYGDTSAHTYKQLKGVLLWDTLLEHPVQEIKVRQYLPIAETLPDLLIMGWKCQQYGTPL